MNQSNLPFLIPTEREGGARCSGIGRYSETVCSSLWARSTRSTEYGGAARRFVIVAHLHLAEQADREKIQPGQQQHRRKNNQRAVVQHHRGVVEEFLYQQP